MTITAIFAIVAVLAILVATGTLVLATRLTSRVGQAANILIGSFAILAFALSILLSCFASAHEAEQTRKAAVIAEQRIVALSQTHRILSTLGDEEYLKGNVISEYEVTPTSVSFKYTPACECGGIGVNHTIKTPNLAVGMEVAALLESYKAGDVFIYE